MKYTIRVSTAFIFFLLFLPPLFAAGTNEGGEGTWQPGGNYSVQQNPNAVANSNSEVTFFLKSLIILVVFGEGAWFLSKKLRKKNGEVPESAVFQELFTYPLGLQSALKIVRIGERYLLLGVTSDNISMLTEITEKEVIDQLKLDASEKTVGKQFFSEVISRYIKGLPVVSPLDNTRNLKKKIDKL